MTENSAVSAYFKKIGSMPLLTREEEQALFARIEQGDEKAGNELVERNLKLVIPTAKQYSKCGIPFADLVQEGSTAIIKARDKFDRTLGNKFSTYATYWIKQRIGRYVKKHIKNVFVPEHVVNLAVQIAKAKRALASEGECEPTDERIAEILERDFGVTADAKTVRETVEACQPEKSMSAKIGEDADTEFGDLLGDDSAPDPASAAESASVEDVLSSAFSELDALEQAVVSARYGIGIPPAGLSVAEIASRFSVSAGEVLDAAEIALKKAGLGESELRKVLAA